MAVLDIIPRRSSADAFVDAPDLAWAKAAIHFLHPQNDGDELQHGLPLQEGCCHNVHVEGEAGLAGPQTLVVPNPHLHIATTLFGGLMQRNAM